MLASESRHPDTTKYSAPRRGPAELQSLEFIARIALWQCVRLERSVTQRVSRGDFFRWKSAPHATAVCMHLSRVAGLALVLSAIAGCSDEIAGSGDPGHARPTGVPSAGMGPFAGGAATPPGIGATPGAAGAGAASPTGSGASASTTLNLAGAPQYSRFVRLTNAQWARSVQD